MSDYIIFGERDHNDPHQINITLAGADSPEKRLVFWRIVHAIHRDNWKQCPMPNLTLTLTGGTKV